jgi:hypothetical protein
MFFHVLSNVRIRIIRIAGHKLDFGRVPVKEHTVTLFDLLAGSVL